ncbi:alpha-1,3-mannosyl-glycoprotein 4-beta-N-acetylglucosaminyltransferase-like protein MGAT4D [Cavia porcellus]|uniref:alpha-1,3-mannosyl-glycoprotein 4-beta-N-acetylglucosaminyltransferase-like protein MGAT4D n=1 Tax=Cavia porcellus TaxID=10141 RepID=UPI002FE36CEE
MRNKHLHWLVAFATLVPIVLFSFSWFCLSRMADMSNQLTSCKNHILEFKENILHLKSTNKHNHEELLKTLTEMTHEIMQRGNQSENLDEKETDTPSKEETISNLFEDFKFFLPHLRKVKRIYPEVLIGQGKTGVSFAVGIPTTSRGNHTYLKQTLNSVVSRMTPWEEKDAVVIVSVADSNEDYVKSVVDMVRKRFKRQVKSGTLEVISVPDFFYPSVIHEEAINYSQKEKRWRIKQVLDFSVLMAYAQPKATYYLQLEDDIIAKKMYFTKLTEFIKNMTSNDWFCVQFSVLGFIGKLFKSKDLPEFVHFFLMFYEERPIDLLVDEIFHIKICDAGEPLEQCLKRKTQVRINYRPSLFQHVGIHSSLPQREQFLKVAVEQFGKVIFVVFMVARENPHNISWEYPSRGSQAVNWRTLAQIGVQKDPRGLRAGAPLIAVGSTWAPCKGSIQEERLPDSPRHPAWQHPLPVEQFNLSAPARCVAPAIGA